MTTLHERFVAVWRTGKMRGSLNCLSLLPPQPVMTAERRRHSVVDWQTPECRRLPRTRSTWHAFAAVCRTPPSTWIYFRRDAARCASVPTTLQRRRRHCGYKTNSGVVRIGGSGNNGHNGDYVSHANDNYIILIIRWQFIKRRKWPIDTPRELSHLTMMGRECSRLDVSFIYLFSYLLLVFIHCPHGTCANTSERSAGSRVW